MFEIPAGTSCEIVRPEQAGAEVFDWDDTVEHKTKHRWIVEKHRLAIDPLGNVAPQAGPLIAFSMHGEDHDTDFGRWEGAILIANHEDVRYG